MSYIYIYIYQALAYEKQGRLTIAHLAMKLRGYRRAKVTRHSPSRRVVACDDYIF